MSVHRALGHKGNLQQGVNNIAKPIYGIGDNAIWNMNMCDATDRFHVSAKVGGWYTNVEIVYIK